MLVLAGSSFTEMRAQGKYVNVICRDGDNSSMKMSEVARVEFKDGTVNMVPKSGAAVSHEKANVLKISFDETGTGLGRVVPGSIILEADGDRILVGGASDNAVINVYDAGGRIVRKANCKAGSGVVNTTGLGAGTYIIKVDAQTRKFIRK